MSSTVLLIGGGGYVGNAIAEILLSEGYNVRVLDCFIYEQNRSIFHLFIRKNYEFIFGDFRLEENLKSALSGVDEVIFLAGLVGDPITKKYPILSEEINLTGLKNAVSQIRRSSLNRFIFISTCSNYGMINDNELANEEFVLNPLSSYSKAKVELEKYILEIFEGSDISAVILRFATAFGMSSRMRLDLTVNEFAYRLAIDEVVRVFDADTWRPYCHVKDFGLLILKVIRAKGNIVDGQIFNAGGDTNNATKRQIVNKIMNHIGSGKVVYEDAGSDRRNYRVDFSKVKRVLNFDPKFSIDDGITEVVAATRLNLLAGFLKSPEEFGNYRIDEQKYLMTVV